MCGIHASLKGQHFEEVLPVWNNRVVREMLGNPSLDLSAAKLIRRGARRPFPSRMHCIPGGPLVSTRRRAVTVLADTKANLDFLVPDGAEQPDHEVFDRCLHTSLNGRGAVAEVRQRQVRFCDVVGMLFEATIKRLSLLLDGFSLRVIRVCFADVDRGFAARKRYVHVFFVAVIVDCVDS